METQINVFPIKKAEGIILLDVQSELAAALHGVPVAGAGRSEADPAERLCAHLLVLNLQVKYSPTLPEHTLTNPVAFTCMAIISQPCSMTHLITSWANN